MSASVRIPDGDGPIDNLSALCYFHQNRWSLVAAAAASSLVVTAATWSLADHRSMLIFLAVHQASVVLMSITANRARRHASADTLMPVAIFGLCLPQTVLSAAMFADPTAARTADFALAVAVVLFAFAAWAITMMGPLRRGLRFMLGSLFGPYIAAAFAFGHPGVGVSAVVFVVAVGGLATARSADLFAELIELRTKAAARAAHAEQVAVLDPLTGLTNRYGLEKLDGTEVESEVAALFIDLDGFKAVNDTLGHRAGDDVLCHVAECLRRHVRARDTVARLGGDEFLVLLWADEQIPVLQIADRIRSAIEAPIAVNAGLASVSASIGVARQAKGPLDLPSLIERADQAVYLAKSMGKNQVIASSVSFHDQAQNSSPAPADQY